MPALYPIREKKSQLSEPGGAEGWGKLFAVPFNLAVWQCQTEFLFSTVGDLGAIEIQLLKVGKSLEMR